MDLRLIPLMVELRLFVRVKICLWKCWTKTLLDKVLWKFQMKMIEVNIFNYNDAELDVSPPEIGWYDTAVSINTTVDSVMNIRYGHARI